VFGEVELGALALLLGEALGVLSFASGSGDALSTCEDGASASRD
jgi:hypothetical protein